MSETYMRETMKFSELLGTTFFGTWYYDHQIRQTLYSTLLVLQERNTNDPKNREPKVYLDAATKDKDQGRHARGAKGAQDFDEDHL